MIALVLLALGCLVVFSFLTEDIRRSAAPSFLKVDLMGLVIAGIVVMMAMLLRIVG